MSLNAIGWKPLQRELAELGLEIERFGPTSMLVRDRSCCAWHNGGFGLCSQTLQVKSPTSAGP